MRPGLRTRGGQFERRWEGGDTPGTHYLPFREAHHRPAGGAELEVGAQTAPRALRAAGTGQLSRQNSHLKDRRWGLSLPGRELIPTLGGFRGFGTCEGAQAAATEGWVGGREAARR